MGTGLNTRKGFDEAVTKEISAITGLNFTVTPNKVRERVRVREGEKQRDRWRREKLRQKDIETAILELLQEPEIYIIFSLLIPASLFIV